MVIPKNWQTIGGMSESAIVSALVRAGKYVFLPAFNAKLRVDLVIKEPEGIVRVQCKTGSLRDGAIHFNTCSSGENRKPQDYRGQADMFAIFYPDNEKTYLVPVDSVGIKSATLRVDPLKKTSKTTKWAADFEINPINPKNIGIKINEEKNNPITKKSCTNKLGSCTNCNKPCDKQAAKCLRCASLEQRKINRPHPLELLKELGILGWEGVGRKYGVTGNAIKKWAASTKITQNLKEEENV